jgi:hypothetical protein
LGDALRDEEEIETFAQCDCIVNNQPRRRVDRSRSTNSKETSVDPFAYYNVSNLGSVLDAQSFTHLTTSLLSLEKEINKNETDEFSDSIP